MKRADAGASGFLAVLAAAACVHAYRLGLGDIHDPGPGFLPFATAGLLGAMAVGRLVMVLTGAVGTGDEWVLFARSRWSAVIIVLGALAGFGVALDTAGFSVSTFFMLVVLFGGVARKRWWVAVGLALLIVAVARLFFARLGIHFPEGWLGG